MMTILYLVLIAHFVGEFLLQATCKYTPWFEDVLTSSRDKWGQALAMHTTLYAFAFLVATPIVSEFVYLPGALWGVFVGIQVLLHLVVNVVASQVNAFILEKNGPRHWFYVGIGATQHVQFVVLTTTTLWFLV